MVTDTGCNMTNKLHLVVGDAIGLGAPKDSWGEGTMETKALLDKCRKIAGHFSRSVKKSRMMRKRQAETGRPEHVLIQNVTTRWNSTYEMVNAWWSREAREEEEPDPALTMVKEYMAEPLQPLTLDPLHYWARKADLWPALSTLALDLLSIPPTSVQSERVFSHMGDVLRPRRSRLDPETVERLTFIRFYLSTLGLPQHSKTQVQSRSAMGSFQTGLPCPNIHHQSNTYACPPACLQLRLPPSLASSLQA
ncbi:hypothetical protein JRQ81_015464 [Phrynocephalus forsythii]|uniref:HAT C-terminal dimerisation domain-containing protein n=1 Tax=Phrynocephalus forsythii TaxID=171643 RepID=A0A9Q0XUL3_9SAUR|nr:hypothetical protein JRQ81_015464 [Phrynocephalus forsythii]